MIDQLWSGMLLFLSAAASNAGRQIWMKIIYIILHSLNSKCKTSLVDMKLPVSVVLEWWSSIGRNLGTVAVYNNVFWYSPTLPEIIIFCFFTMLHVSGSFFIVELEYLEPKVVLCHTLVTEQIVTSTRHSKSNVRKSNSIELNPWIEFDWVRQSNEIEHHTFSEFDFRTNRTQSVWLCSSEFGNRSQSNTIKWISFDWLWWTYTKQAQSKPVKAIFSCAFFIIYSITQTQTVHGS